MSKKRCAMRNALNGLAVGLLLAASTAPAVADVLLIEEVRESMRRDLPKNGLSTEQVEQRWGAPVNRSGPVGDPPITRWVYDDYSVYFEYDLVIDSVLHRGAVVRATSGDDG